LGWGLLWGSFVNVLIHRLPRREDIVRQASRCPQCGAPIRAYQNIPVLSYLWLRGRSACCAQPISIRYPLVELLCGVLAVAIMAQQQFLAITSESSATPSLDLGLFALLSGLSFALVAAIFIDLEFMILPDLLTLGGMLLGLVSAPIRGMPITESLSAGAFGFALVYLPFIFGYQKLRGVQGMGRGDAKLTALAGAWFGWWAPPFVLCAGAVQALIVVATFGLLRTPITEPAAVKAEREAALAEVNLLSAEAREDALRELEKDPLFLPAERGFRKARIAFGPFICLALLEWLFFQSTIRAWLLGDL
jgi:leader peptidase (prepilin peptidase)/N-methyltransferase